MTHDAATYESSEDQAMCMLRFLGNKDATSMESWFKREKNENSRTDLS